MRYKQIITSFSFIAVASLATACSRNKAVAGSPTPARTASADRAAIDAADRENAKLREDADRAGAAQRADAKTSDEIKSTITTPVHFEFDHSDITDQGLQLLDAKVEALQSNTSIRIRIEGNADDSGSDEYNLVLSQKRAAIVNQYFTDRGIAASRIQIVSYGEEHPVCKGTEEPCRSQNRRDEFVILSGL